MNARAGSVDQDPAPGLSLLLALLREEPQQLPLTFTCWAEALRLAEQHAIAPFLVACVRRAETHGRIAMEPGVRMSLLERHHRAVREAFWWTAELRGLLASFASVTIPVLPLKGPVLAERLYGSAVNRSCRDLDLLVRRSDFTRACALLSSLGFIAAGRADDYHQPWRRGTTGMELHFDVENSLALDFHTYAAFARSQQTTFAGKPALRFSAPDELLYLCVHGARHRFSRLGHVLDLALALRHFPAATTQEAVQHNPGLRSLLVLGCAMAHYLLPQATSGGAALDLRSMPGAMPDRHLQHIADELWAELVHSGPVQNEELDWAAQHRFLRSLQPWGVARARTWLRHARILLTRLISPDYDFAARFGIRHPALVWLLRQMRLAWRFISRTTCLSERNNSASP